MKGKKVYISGKITGIESEAPALFEAAEREIMEKGGIPVNPMKLNHNHDKSWEAYMREDIKALCDCDVIYMMSNFRQSRGANIELSIAKILGLKVVLQIEKEADFNK